MRIYLFVALCTLAGAVQDFQNDTIKLDEGHVSVRSLQAIADFVPLSCNSNLAGTTCSTWTSKFGSSATQSSRIVIPCGQCITMNHPGPTLTLQDGVDVQGKLVFPDSYKLVVNTPLLVVQGELEMTSTKPVDGVPSIKIVLTGSNDQSFTPIGQNANACGGGKCSVGKKSFTVAGGKVNSESIENY
jgi:G8 domain